MDNLTGNLLLSMRNQQTDEIITANLIAITCLYLSYKQRLNEHVYGLQQTTIDTLQEELIVEKSNAKEYFKNTLKKSDLPLSERRYYDGQQDMLNKIKE